MTYPISQWTIYIISCLYVSNHLIFAFVSYLNFVNFMMWVEHINVSWIKPRWSSGESRTGFILWGNYYHKKSLYKNSFLKISFLCTIVEVRPIINSAVLSSSESPTDDNLTVTVNSWSDLYLFDRAMNSDLSRFFNVARFFLKMSKLVIYSLSFDPLDILDSLFRYSTILLTAIKLNSCLYFIWEIGFEYRKN